ncbi:MAG: glucosaminidase domain-containing protein [Thiohalospira sp.]
MSSEHSEPLNERALAWQVGSALLVALLLGSWLYLDARTLGPAPWEPEVDMLTLEVGSAAEMAATFDAIGYDWPPGPVVPALTLAGLPSDMADLPATERKTLFLRVVLPSVLRENERLEAMRLFIRTRLGTATRPDPESVEGARLARLIERYRVDPELPPERLRERLLHRVDRLPVGLVLAQAANESGWGTSRFAREGNNLFGVWTYTEGAGLRPEGAASDARHSVRIYPDLDASIRGYFYTVNVGRAYESLRDHRAELRAAGGPPSASELAAGLTRYSERGEAYVEELRSMLEFNGLPAMALGTRDLRTCERRSGSPSLDCGLQASETTHQSRLNQ